MTVPTTSITRRLIIAILLVECIAGLALVVTLGNHEKQVQFLALDANLSAFANALFGAIQEADTEGGRIHLDQHNLVVPRNAMYVVVDENGQKLGGKGEVPPIHNESGNFTRVKVHGESYRFLTLAGDRVIDPGSSREVDHHVTVIYGLPEGHVWHEVFEEVRYLAGACLVLLGVTAIILIWTIRRFLAPIHELASEADRINADNWRFRAPEGSMRFRELNPLGAALEKTLSRLHRSFDQQRRFTSDAAHELKTDVAIVKSSLELTAMKKRTAEEYELRLQEQLEDVRRLEATVQKMLTLARLEQMAPQEKVSTCDFAEAILDSISQNSSVAELKGVRVLTNGLDLPSFVAIGREDAILLCSNVLFNAVTHSPDAGSIEVQLGRVSTQLTLSVKDEGNGVDPQDLPFLFDAFYRGDASRSRASGGTGLGLSICKAILDRAGGSISIENHISGGAIVQIEIPLIAPI